MQVFLQMVAFSLQSDGSGRPVLTKGKRPYSSIAAKFYCGAHPQRHGAISRERKLTKTLFIVTVVSLILLLPLNIFYLVFFSLFRRASF